MESILDDYLVELASIEDYECRQSANTRDMKPLTDEAISKSIESLYHLIKLDSYVSYTYTMDGQQHLEYIGNDDDDAMQRVSLMTDKQSTRIIYMKLHVHRRPAYYKLTFSSDAVKTA